MNWQAISFDWNQVRAFLATAEEGSLSAAARVLGQTQPTLGRQIAALEQDLGVALFERVGRGLILAPAGHELLAHVRAMAEAAAHVSLVASGQSQSIEGVVRITASDIMASHVLPPAIAALRVRAPKLEVELISANDIQDLQQREADIAVRHVRPEEPELVARLVRDETARFYGTQAYLKRMGRPKTKADLSKHEFVAFGDADEMIGYMEPLGIYLTRDNVKVRSENGNVMTELARQGLGLSILMERVADADGDFEAVLPDMEPITFPVWLITHRELHTSRKIRLVFDHLAEFLGGLE